MAGYVELHCHSAFSFLDGASLPTELVEQAVRLGYPALALTDHDGLHGAMEFAQAAKGAGLQPITGAELTLTDGSHLTLLVETPAGYANLCRLITQAHRTSPRLDPRLAMDELERHAEGLILLTGCRQGQLSQFVAAGQFDQARALLRRYIDWFGATNVFVELQQTLSHGDNRRIARLVRLAQEAGVSIVATNNVHYHGRERHQLQDVLVAIKHRTTLDASHQLRRTNSEAFLQPAQVMARRFRRYPEALVNTLVIAERCAAFDLTKDLNYRFPDYPTDPGETPDDVLARETTRLLAERYGDHAQAKARLAEELALIRRHGLAGFFLLYRDIMRLATEVAAEVRGTGARSAYPLPPGRGRGSSVSSIICYLFGLSHIDPLHHNLFLGRFLNEELASVPDIDLDFPRDIRARLIERVYEEYGHDRVALVCAFPTYHIRSAIRDIGKALGLPAADLDQLAKVSEHATADRLAIEMERLAAFRHRRDAPLWHELVELATQIAGFPRHVSQHSGGMVISSQPLIELVPVQPAAMAGRHLCQWDKDSIDDARMVKVDFLALGMLSAVEESLELIAASGKPVPDLSRINFSDPKVYRMIQEGDTIGTFQIESRAQIQTLSRTQPETLEDLIVQVAIVRPGPIVGGAVQPYIEQRRNRRLANPPPPTFDHPLLEPVLRETHGVILYQEQILEVAICLAGFTAGQADQLRRAMSRKRSEAAMSRFWEQFRDGAAANGVSEDVAQQVFRKILGFAAYGFPKSHAAAFAVLAYQSSWLKRYYPAEFLASLLNCQPMGFYPPHVLTNDAKRHGVRIFPPDINQSGARCTVEGRAVRIGLGYVDEVGEEPAARIVVERQINGPFRSLRDLLRRVPLKREAVDRLCLVGAFDGLGLGRREALWQAGLFIPARRFTRGGETGQQLTLDLPVEQDLVQLRPMSPREQMEREYEALGLSPHYHPLGLLRPHLPAGLRTTTDLVRIRDGTTVRVAGMVVCRQRPGTAKGVTFLLLEDEHGLINVIVWPKLYDQQRLLVRSEPFLVVEGRLQRREGTLNIIAHRLRSLDEARRAFRPPPAHDLSDLMPDEAAETAREESPRVAPSAHNFH